MHASVRPWLAAALSHQSLPEWPADAEALMTSADAEGVLLLLEQRLQTHPQATALPRDWLLRLQAAARMQVQEQMAMLAEQQRVFHAVAQAGIPFLVMKGGALAHWLYAKPYLRLVTDLDLLLPERATLTQLRPALATLGYTMAPEAGSRVGDERAFLKLGGPYGHYTVDAHWALLNSPILADCFGFDELSAEAQELPGGTGVRGLSAVHALCNACGHRVLNLPYHYVQGIQNARSLRWLWDIHLLVQALTEADWRRLDALAREKGLCGILSDSLDAAMAELGSPVPEAVLAGWRVVAKHERIRMQWFASWPRFQWRQFLASADSTAGRLQWLGQRLWPDVEAMRERYGEPGEPGWRILWRRLGVGLRRLFS